MEAFLASHLIPLFQEGEQGDVRIRATRGRRGSRALPFFIIGLSPAPHSDGIHRCS